jgi:hypothetical protein
MFCLGWDLFISLKNNKKGTMHTKLTLIGTWPKSEAVSVIPFVVG